MLITYTELTFSNLWADSADDKMIFSYFFSIRQTVISCQLYKKIYFKMFCAEIFSQQAKCFLLQCFLFVCFFV